MKMGLAGFDGVGGEMMVDGGWWMDGWEYLLVRYGYENGDGDGDGDVHV